MTFRANHLLITNSQIDFNLEEIIEGFFLLNIIRNFTTSFPDDHTGLEVTDLRRIVPRYFYGSFLLDMIPTIPISLLIPDTTSTEDLLYLVKLLRLK